jgi:hypothetical protein
MAGIVAGFCGLASAFRVNAGPELDPEAPKADMPGLKRQNILPFERHDRDLAGIRL